MSTPPSQPGPPKPSVAADELEFRRRFLKLGDADAETLRSLLPMFEQYEQAFVEDFYGHLKSFPFTAAFLRDPVRFERLKQLQQHHFHTLLEAQWNDEFFTARRRVGDVHADVGIEPQYFIGAYYLYLQHCLRHVLGADSDEPERRRACEASLSLVKAVFLDVGLTLDAYFRQSTQKVNDALDMLWKANQELRQFAQLTTHDLKTPLATVANLCEETLDEFGAQMPEEARKLVETARARIFRMSALIDELLTTALSSESTDRLDRIDLERAVLDAVERLRPMIKQKRLQLTLPAKWPAVWANPVRLREAMYNIVSNAVKFVAADVGRIEIDTSSLDGRVRISVSDNGPGIPKDELTRIFSPFRRLPIHRNQPGSGLGLYFAKNLIEAIGGQIWAESDSSGGSVFHVELHSAEEPSPPVS